MVVPLIDMSGRTPPHDEPRAQVGAGEVRRGQLVRPTNVGAILRSGAALGFDAVLLAPRCADPLYRRAIKVAMGAVFTCRGPASPTGTTPCRT